MLVGDGFQLFGIQCKPVHICSPCVRNRKLHLASSFPLACLQSLRVQFVYEAKRGLRGR